MSNATRLIDTGKPRDIAVGFMVPGDNTGDAVKNAAKGMVAIEVASGMSPVPVFS